MRVIGIGHLLLALGLAGIGALSLGSGDFAYVWQPVPMWVPGREFLAYASGILLVAGCIGLLLKRTAGLAAFIVAAYVLLWVLVLQVPRVINAPGDMGMWLGMSLTLILMAGGWILFASLAGPQDRIGRSFITSENGMRVARFLMGAGCFGCGLSHFVYTAATASMVPAWLPDRVGFAYLTGAGHCAAGIGLMLAIFPRLAATLEAAMLSLFVLLIHIPAVVAEPGSRMYWTMAFIASAYAGSVWNAARSLNDSSWGWARRTSIATTA
jgi:uncharacterized membrane protein